ncbi:hypothetical protein P153DRAFT_178788 [Dothidotthia symphoricarpi CBS 119687]|uniref:C2H2-type domain-containing protein n=1 Tax=Dothidotthia symphoricarpi CBS 119687 TaxID=1392245 RepID=A0A6A6APV7_9PLEO|nr:uncharacterized protein P153DRAFT_178788 [Dothidotthia symphoricarpi CBS 119687]KAF2133055.1 hypothetical protein P153DRAFT_178788 [Dothidotthia symphoricarpi CBS 119687]
MVPGSQCSTTMSSTSPQSPPYLERQCTSPRGLGDAEYSVPCPYRCGTILTGVHAIGNLTRHIKSQSCTASGRTKAKYPCPIGGCDREYTRSDGLKVHMRRRHNAPPALPKNDAAVENDDD